MKWGYYMAYLHKDANVFAAVITQVSQKLGVPEAIVEKDYYVNLAIKFQPVSVHNLHGLEFYYSPMEAKI